MDVCSRLANPYTSPPPGPGQPDRIYQLINKMLRVEHYISVNHSTCLGHVYKTGTPKSMQPTDFVQRFASGWMLRTPVPDAELERGSSSVITVPQYTSATCQLSHLHLPMLSVSVSMHSLTPEYSPGGAGGWINPRSLRNLFSCRQLNPSSFQFSSSKSMSLLLSILARLKSIFKQSPSRLAPPTDDRSGTGRTKVEAAISAIFGHLLLCHPSGTGGKRL